MRHALDANTFNLIIPGRRHTFPERGLRPYLGLSALAQELFGRRHTFPERGLRLQVAVAPPPLRFRPKAHVPREGFET